STTRTRHRPRRHLRPTHRTHPRQRPNPTVRLPRPPGHQRSGTPASNRSELHRHHTTPHRYRTVSSVGRSRSAATSDRGIPVVALRVWPFPSRRYLVRSSIRWSRFSRCTEDPSAVRVVGCRPVGKVSCHQFTPAQVLDLIEIAIL